MGMFGKVVLSAAMLFSGMNVPAGTVVKAADQNDPFSFFVLSDTHVRDESSNAYLYLEDALQDIQELDPGNEALIVSGDLTESGSESEYSAFYGLIDEYAVGQPILIMGNHDVRWQCNGATSPSDPTIPTCPAGTSTYAERYLSFNGQYMGDIPEDQLYFDQWIEGYHFIALNTEKDLKDQAYLSEKQLSWLEEKLAEQSDPNRPIFLTIHQSFSDVSYQTENEEAYIGAQEEQLKEILSDYPQTVIMTGHTHPSISFSYLHNNSYGHVVEIPSLNYSAQIGYQVIVHADHIQLRAYDFANDRYLDQFEKEFKLSDLDTDTQTDADFDAFDLDTSSMSVSAGSENASSGREGPASNVLDHDENTIWHTKYGGTPINDNWINIHLEEKQIVNGLRYLPRVDGGTNGTFIDYEIYYSVDDGQTYEKIMDGTWRYTTPAGWKIAEFDAVEATDIRLQPVSTYTTYMGGNEYGSAAEIRLINIPEIGELRDSLNNLVASCEDIHQEDHLVSGWEAYQNALDEAEAVLANENATSSELIHAMDALTTAIAQLEPRPTVDDPIIHPVSASAGSSYGGNQNPMNVINGVGLDGDGLDARHDNEGSAKTMWHTAANPGANAWFEVDLGESYPLDEMWIWNINQSNNATRGFRNVKIEYSIDGEEWSELQPEEDMIFEEETSADYPFQFAQSSGISGAAATNLNDGENSPVRFHGIQTRYIRITAAPTAGEGSWGQAYYGLSELKFTQYFSSDKTELSDLIRECEKMQSEGYTTSSWEALLQALNDAKIVNEDENASQEDVDTAVEQLQQAVVALQTKASDSAFAALQNMVDKADALGSDDEALNAAIETAQALLSDPDNASVTAVVGALLDLSEAMQALNMNESTNALRADVQATIDFINVNILTNLGNIRPSKVQALRDAITAAQKLLANEDAAADQLKAANKAMTKAAQELWEIVSKAELNALIEAANGYLDGDYTAESLEELQAAITAAQAVAANDDATTSEVTDAITSLANAIAGLESITLDTSALEHEIELVTEMVANIGNYVPSTVEGLADKLADAQAAMNATSQEEIDAATQTLREARLNARTKADVSALEELVAYVNSLDLNAYTSASVAAMNVPYTKALVMIENEEVTQEQVNELAEEMQAAIDALEPVNANVTSPNAGNADSSNNSTTAESANTAAVTQTGMMLALLAAAGAATLIIRRKRS